MVSRRIRATAKIPSKHGSNLTLVIVIIVASRHFSDQAFFHAILLLSIRHLNIKCTVESCVENFPLEPLCLATSLQAHLDGQALPELTIMAVTPFIVTPSRMPISRSMTRMPISSWSRAESL